jgi:hypothetical protein
MDELNAELSPTMPIKRSVSESPTIPASLPLPNSPTRKRPRLSDWEPPDHIPEFLPPFPQTHHSPTPEPATPAFELQQLLPPSVPSDIAPVDQTPVNLNQAVTSSVASDYLAQVPYSQSSLSAVPEWHLPTEPHAVSLAPARTNRYPTPQTEPSLLAAYHHILTHPPPSNVSMANPARHKVAMQLLALTEEDSRWDPPDTLYSNTAPNTPRVNSSAPTFPVASQSEVKIPASTRPILSSEQVTYLVGRQFSRVPDLAKRVLPVCQTYFCTFTETYLLLLC